MASSAEQIRNWNGPALFGYGFRPFFLGAAVFAALAMAVWIGALAGLSALALGRQVTSALDAVIHLEKTEQGRRIQSIGRLVISDDGTLRAIDDRRV